MRNKLTRSERRQIHRETRIERAIATIESKGRSKKKKNTGLIYMLVVIILAFVMVKFIQVTKFQRVYSVPISSVDRFEENYNNFIENSTKKFDYKKNIESKTYPDENLVSYIQESTGKTGNYIQLNISEDSQVLQVEAIGQYRADNSDFPVAFKENILIITGILFDQDYKEAEEMLKKDGVLDGNGNLYIKKFRKEKNDYIISFDVIGNKFNYAISKNK